MLERMLPSTVRGRLTLTFGALSILVILVLGAFLIFSVRGRYENRLASQLEEQARMAGSSATASLLANAPGSEIDAQIDALGSAIPTRLTIINSSGQMVADSQSDPATIPPADALQAIEVGLIGDEDVVRAHQDGSMVVTVPVQGVPGAVARASTSLEEVDDVVGRFQRNVLATGLIVSWISLVVAIYVAGRITGPLAELRQHAGLVSTGQFESTVTPGSTREFGDLARAFNTMTRRVRELVEESEQSRSRLEAIFANLSDGVVIVDQHLTVIGINDSAASILGTRLNWAVGRPFVVVARDADLNQLLSTAFESGKQQSGTIDHGRTDHILDAVAQAVDRQGERLGIVVIRDVTELKRLESVRREFVANVSHELRTPLASIRALVETLEAGAIDDPTVAGDFLGRVVGEVTRLTALVDELLDLARLESGRITLKLESFEPATLIVSGVERLRPQIERARLSLNCGIDPALPSVLADRGRIEQVLLNLVHNAIKFTKPGGSILVTAEVEGRFVAVSVSDTGVGIEQEELPRVFERFYKSDKARRSEGTGLGLAIAKHIIQAHGGSIWVNSQPGKGTTFTFTLRRDGAQDMESEPILHGLLIEA